MKKTIILLLFCLTSILGISQGTNTVLLTPEGILDTVYDEIGNKYLLRNLHTESPYDVTGSTARPAPTLSCTAGYFNLHFAVGSCFDDGTTAASDKRTTICQLFSDISGFINSPLTTTGVKINVYCDNTTSALGSATSIFAVPLNPFNPNQGIADCQVYKAIMTGTNPWANLPITLFPSSTSYYSCIIRANPSGSVNWNNLMSVGSIGAGQYDFYSVMLHEVTHALGFQSLINYPGVSKFGAVNNYFSRFDKFLTNAAGSPLLVGSSPCTVSNLVFTGPATQIAPGSCTTNTNQDLTTCGTAAKYVGSVNIKVYTPNCFEPPSSLSHFEDMCSTPASFTTSCTSTPPGTNNNLYFVMSDANGLGNCYVKRYLNEEERYVLCDLGYSVNAVYNSPAVNATHNYTSGACPGSGIWGVNDGLTSTGAYNYLATGATYAIPLSSITGNDFPTNNIVSCIEVVYNNATASIVGSNLIVNGTIGQGLVLLKYLPKHPTTGKYGNATYIYVYFLPGNCNPPNACNMVQNGGFESAGTGPCGGEMYNPAISASLWPKPSCWGYYESQSTDIFSKSCTSNGGTYNLGINTMNSAPVVNSFNGSNRVAGICVAPNTSNLPFYATYEEDLKNNLSSPLVPGQAYQISFWAYSYSGPNTSTGINPNKSPVVITCASAPNFASAGSNFPSGLNVLKEFTVNVNSVPGSTLWTQFTNTFVFSGTSPENALIIGFNPTKTNSYGLLPGFLNAYVFIDDVSLMPLPTPTFAIPNNVVCAGTSFTNLAQYASTVSGTFSGPGVSLNGSQYDFNNPPTLPPGSYAIAFTYTNSGCTHTITQQVFLGGVSSGTNSLFCSYNNYTLTPVGYPATTSYTWMPGTIVSPTLAVSGSVGTTYTLLTNSAGCNQVLFTPTIVPTTTITSLPSPWCGNTSNPLGVAIPGFTVPAVITQTWSVGSLTVPVVFVNYTGIINPVYTVTTSVSGCTNVASYTATWTPPYTLSVTSTATINCLNPGQSATLTAWSTPPVATFTWQPSGPNTSSIVVTPTATTIYTVNSSFGGCAATQTIDVIVAPPITFTNLPTNWCKNQCITYLENYLAASTPTGGSWTAPGTSVAVVGGSVQTTACLSSTLAPGVYTITYTYIPPPGRCWVTKDFTVNVLQDFPVQVTAPNILCTNLTSSVVISAVAGTSATTTYSWYPGPLVGQTQTVTPTVTTTYTVLANNGSCTYSATTTVSVSNQCCAAANQFTSGVVNSGTFLGQYAVNQNLTIYGYVEFGGEFKMAPNVSITVTPGATLTSIGGSTGSVTYQGLHMYSCTDMWNGIVVQDGGKVIFKSRDLIEDAKTAVYSNGCTNTSGNFDIWMDGVVFNRNYAAISINNYAQNTANPPFEIKNCVITCRDLNVALGATVWPTASIAGVGALRAATTPVTPLSSPYVLNNYTPANLKVPYSNQPSYVGVYVENCGLTINPTNVTPTYYNIIVGEKAANTHTAYNIFDNQMYGIFALNSNVSSFDNVLQYSRRVSLGSPRPTWQGGYAIYSINNGSNPLNYNSSLNLVGPTNPSVNNNAVYDCQLGIYGYFLHNVSADYISIQSTRNSNVAATTTSYGQMGIFLQTCKTKDYKVSYGNYKNIQNCIQMIIGYGNLNLPGFPSYGGYLGSVDIKYNLFTPATGTAAAQGSGGIDNGVYIVSAGIVAGSSFTQAGTAMRIQYNTFDRVMRGVMNNGHSGSFYTGFTANNKISLAADPFGNPQYGIYHVATPASVVNTNTIIGFGTANTLVSGVYGSQITSSAVQCNDISNLYAGFDFNSSSTGVSWRNNIMTTQIRGMSLNNNGIIGTQGSWGLPHDNYWTSGSAYWNGGRYNTWTDVASFAANSKLYVKSSSSYTPTNNDGGIQANSYFTLTNLIAANNSAGTYTLCPTPGNPPPPQGLMAGGNDEELLNDIASDNMVYTVNPDETAEINKILLYKTIEANDSLTIISDTLNNFYNQSSQQEIGILDNLEKQFTNGNLMSAAGILNSFNPNSNIQNNYKQYFSLYSNYITNDSLNNTDSLSLALLAHQCPFTDGPIVYRARALYDLVNQTVVIYNDANCGDEGYTARSNANGNTKDTGLEQLLKINEKKNLDKLHINYRIYPNPAVNEIYISSNKEKEMVKVIITDVSGKEIVNRTLTLTNYKTGLKLDLLNGIYFVNLSNESGERTTKKLVINK